jgi:hypothetical protein
VKTEKTDQTTILEWVKSTSGQFTLKDIYNELYILSPESKAYVRVIMRRLKQAGIVEALGKRDGIYRLVDTEAPEENWQTVDKRVVELKFPFELEKYIRILPKSLIIIAGSPGAGKTALLYNIVCLNMYEFGIHLFNNEMGLMQIQERFNAIDPNIPNPPPFHIRHREENFADVIEPDAINLVDYLDMDSEVYMIGFELKKILAKLNDGIAIVAIQKPIGRELGYGAGYSLKSAALYLSMDRGRLKIIKARERADSRVDPINKVWSFRFDSQGANFLNIRDARR